MSLSKQFGLGQTKQNMQGNLRESLIETYSSVGREVDDRGRVLNEGVNWLKGLNEHDAANMALLYENQAREMLNEFTDTSSSGAFETMAFPMIRRIFSSLLANKIVSVQAISHPQSVMYFFYPQISNRNEFTDSDGNTSFKHSAFQAKQLPNCVGHNCPVATFENCKSLYDLYYNDGLYDHSKGEFYIVVATGTPIEILDDGCDTGSTIAGQALATDGTLRRLKMELPGFADSARANAITARLKEGNRGLEYDTHEFLTSFQVMYRPDTATTILGKNNEIVLRSGDTVDFRLVSQKYASPLVDPKSSYLDYCDIKGALPVELMFEVPANECVDCTSIDDYTGVGTGSIADLNPEHFVFTWREYKDLEAASEIGEVSFTLKRVSISVRPRKLRARWTPELQADVNAYHNINVEAELTNMLSEQVAMEIDREILRQLKTGAAWVSHWDYYGWKTQGSQKYTEKEWKQTLITKVNQISAQIHKSTLRGHANFLVISTEVSALFDDLKNFYPAKDIQDSDKFSLGIEKIGTVGSRYDIYVDPYAKPYEILIGHKGSNIFDTGFIYAPYEPLRLIPTVVDYENDTRVKAISTRYATHMVNNRFYGKIIVDRIPSFDTAELR